MPEISRKIILNLFIVAVLLLLPYSWGWLEMGEKTSLLIAVYVVLTLLVLLIATRLDRHADWLNKGHTRARATEILVPPGQMVAVRKLLNHPDMDESEAFLKASGCLHVLGNKVYSTLVSLAYLAAPLVLAVGIGLTLHHMTQLEAVIKTGHIDAEVGRWGMFFGPSGIWTLLGIFLSVSCFVNARILSAGAEANLEKVRHLLVQRFTLRNRPGLPPRLARMWVFGVSVLALALVPMAMLQSRHLQTFAAQQGELTSLSHTKAGLQLQISAMEARLEEIKNLSAEAEKKAAEAIKRRDVVQSVLNRTDADWKKEKARADELTKKLESEQKKAADLQRQMKSLTDARTKLENEQKALTEKLKAAEALAAKLPKAEEAVAAAKMDLELAKVEVSALQKRLAAQTLPVPAFNAPQGARIQGSRVIVGANTLFEGRTPALAANGSALLSTLGASLKGWLDNAPASAVLVVAVHTDGAMPEDPNIADVAELSALQAQAIAKQLQQSGIAARRLLAAGHADRIAPQSGSAQRVEIYLAYGQ